MNEESKAMVTLSRRERGGMPLWAVAAALLSAALSCAAFFAATFLALTWEVRWLSLCLEWFSFAAFAAVPLWLTAGLMAARKKPASVPPALKPDCPLHNRPYRRD
jgi:hypothetical protein